MLEIAILTMSVGTLGLQSTLIGGWLHWRQRQIQRQQQQEEDTLTLYEVIDENADPIKNTAVKNMALDSDSEHKGKLLQRDPRLVGWEFKIVRAQGNLFRHPEHFQTLCEEEAEAGWILLEKLDDNRVRFKRPIAMRQIINPDFLNFDPYRSHYGNSLAWKTWLGAIATIALLTLPAYVGYVLVSRILANDNATTPGQTIQTASPSQRTLSRTSGGSGKQDGLRQYSNTFNFH